MYYSMQISHTHRLRGNALIIATIAGGLINSRLGNSVKGSALHSPLKLLCTTYGAYGHLAPAPTPKHATAAGSLSTDTGRP